MSMVENIVRQWLQKHDYPEEALSIYGAAEPGVVIVGEAHNLVELMEPQLELCGLLGSTVVAHETFRDWIFDTQKRVIFRCPQYPSASPSIKREYERVKREHKKVDRKNFIEAEREIDDYFKRKRIRCFLSAMDIADLYSLDHYFLERIPETVQKVRGCDLPYPLPKFPKYNVCDVREKRMGEIVEHEAIRTKEPLLVIVGQYHILDNSTSLGGRRSAIHDILKEKGISYICVNQTLTIEGV